MFGPVRARGKIAWNHLGEGVSWLGEKLRAGLSRAVGARTQSRALFTTQLYSPMTSFSL